MNKINMLLFLVPFLFLQGCNLSKKLSPVVNQVNNLIVNVENYIKSVPAEQLVTTSQKIVTPVKIVKSAIGYIESQVDDVNVKEALQKVLGYIGDESDTISLLGILALVTEDNVETSRDMITGKIVEVRGLIASIASSLGVELSNPVLPRSGEAVSIEDLVKLAEELESKIK